TLNNPVIGEDGRRFLADLLVQLSDHQIRDLFEVARVQLRLQSPGDVSSGFATVDEWIDAFKEKRTQIVDRRCACNRRLDKMSPLSVGLLEPAPLGIRVRLPAQDPYAERCSPVVAVDRAERHL